MKIPQELNEWLKNGEFHHLPEVDAKVFCRQFGSRDATASRTLLLLHGFPESSYSYHKITEPLLSLFDRILTFDLPGFGLSDKPKNYSYSLIDQADIVLEIWKRFGIQGGHLLAHDMGDSVATELLHREVHGMLPDWFTEGIRSYTFTNGGMILELASLRFTQHLLRKPLAGPLLSRLSSYPLFRHQVRSASGCDSLPDREIEIMWAYNRFKNGKRIMHKLISYLDDREQFQDTRWLPSLKVTNRPIHICWGEMDRVAPVSIADRLKEKYCPEAEVTRMADTGHFCQLENPRQWVKSISGFYNKIR